MTYLELAYEAAHEYDRGLIALEEYNEKIKPLCVEINQKDNWIPVSERLPEEGKDVLITILLRNGVKTVEKSKRVDVTMWRGFGRDVNVIAWMPLPEPCHTESEDK